MLLFGRGVARALAGDLAGADADLGCAHVQAQAGVHRAVRGHVWLALAAVSARLGRIEQARTLLDEGCDGLPPAEQEYLGLRAVAEGCLAAATGRHEQAAVHLADARAQSRRPFWTVLAGALGPRP